MICTYLTIRYIWSFSDGDGDEHTLYFIHINVYNKNWVRKAIHIYIVRVASGVAVFVVFRYICYFVFSFFLFCSEAIKKKSFGFVGAFCSTFPECEDEKELHADKKGANEKKIFIIYNLIYIFICWKQRTGIKWCYISRLTLCCCCFFYFYCQNGRLVCRMQHPIPIEQKQILLASHFITTIKMLLQTAAYIYFEYFPSCFAVSVSINRIAPNRHLFVFH